jgi:hypothetical protein
MPNTEAIGSILLVAGKAKWKSWLLTVDRSSLFPRFNLSYEARGAKIGQSIICYLLGERAEERRGSQALLPRVALRQEDEVLKPVGACR